MSLVGAGVIFGGAGGFNVVNVVADVFTFTVSKVVVVTVLVLVEDVAVLVVRDDIVDDVVVTDV